MDIRIGAGIALPSRGSTLNPNRIVGGIVWVMCAKLVAGVNYDASANSGTLAQSATLSLSSRF